MPMFRFLFFFHVLRTCSSIGFYVWVLGVISSVSWCICWWAAMVIICFRKLEFQYNVLLYCADMCSAAFWYYRILGNSLWNWRNQWDMCHGAVLIHTLHLSWRRRKWPSFPYILMDQNHLKLQSRRARFFTCKFQEYHLHFFLI